MKKLTVFEINDGLDGVVLAKSLKQAIKKLVPYYGCSVKDFIDNINKCEKGHCWDGDWTLTGEWKEPKKGKYKRTKILGWCES